MTSAAQARHSAHSVRHTGTMFLSRTKPDVGAAANGDFQLLLLLFDRIGPHAVEPWRVTWAGPDAKRFWDEHKAQLVPGAALTVSLERARIHTLRSQPPQCEIHARVIEADLAPARHADQQAANG